MVMNATAATMRVIGLLVEELREEFGKREDRVGDPIGPDRVQHRGGLDIALDGFNDDDCAGLVWTNVLRRFPTTGDQFPAEVPTPSTSCVLLSAITVQVGVARCSTMMDDQGNGPPASEYDHEAIVLIEDSGRLDRVLCRVGNALVESDVVGCGRCTEVNPSDPRAA